MSVATEEGHLPTSSPPTPREPVTASSTQGSVGAASAPPASSTTTAPGAGSARATKFDIIVIGAGLSGLATALSVAKSGRTVALLEARSDRVGGRVESVFVGPGSPAQDTRSLLSPTTIVRNLANSNASSISKNVIDRGGTWIGTAHTEVLKVCDRYAVPLTNQYNAQAHSTYVSKTALGVVAKTHTGSPFGFWGRKDVAQLMKRITALTAEIDIERPWSHPRAVELDAESVASYFRRKAWTNDGMKWISSVTRDWAGCEASEISLLFFLHGVKSAGGLEYALEVEKGAMKYRVDGGAQRLADNMLAELLRGYSSNALFVPGAYVSSIIQIAAPQSLAGEGSNVFFHVSAVSEDSSFPGDFFAQTVICSANPAVFLRQTRFSPGIVPAQVSQFARRAFNGSYGKAHVVYETAWWRDAGLNGNFVDTTDSIVSSGFDVSKPGFNALVLFFSAGSGVAAATMEPAKRREAVIKCLQRVFPHQAAEVPKMIGYDEKLWATDPFAQGCSGVLYPPGCFRHYSAQKLLRDGIVSRPPGQPPATESDLGGKIYFVGTDVSSEFVGYMEGALRSSKALCTKLFKTWM